MGISSDAYISSEAYIETTLWAMEEVFIDYYVSSREW